MEKYYFYQVRLCMYVEKIFIQDKNKMIRNWKIMIQCVIQNDLENLNLNHANEPNFPLQRLSTNTEKQNPNFFYIFAQV